MANHSSWIYPGQQPSEKVKPGDMIEISRMHGLYKHWALYMGENEVMHVVKKDDREATIKQEELENVVRSDQWEVNNYLDEICNARDIQDILEEARKSKGKVPYNLLTNNCEHMVTHWRNDKSESRQVQEISIIASASIIVIVVTIAVVAPTARHYKKRKEKRRHGRRQITDTDCRSSTTGSTEEGEETELREEDESESAYGRQRRSTGPTKEGEETVSEVEDAPQNAYAYAYSYA